MKCSEVRELLLTDFSDQELSKEEKKRIETHLKTCDNCQAFEIKVREQVLQPFSEDSLLSPSKKIWDNIEKNISQTKLQKGKQRLFRPVFHWAAVAAIFLIAIIPVRMSYLAQEQKALYTYFDEQFLFLDQLEEEEPAGFYEL